MGEVLVVARMVGRKLERLSVKSLGLWIATLVVKQKGQVGQSMRSGGIEAQGLPIGRLGAGGLADLRQQGRQIAG